MIIESVPSSFSLIFGLSSWSVQLVHLAGPFSWSPYPIHLLGLSTWSLQLTHLAGLSTWTICLGRLTGPSTWFIYLVCLALASILQSTLSASAKVFNVKGFNAFQSVLLVRIDFKCKVHFQFKVCFQCNVKCNVKCSFGVKGLFQSIQKIMGLTNGWTNRVPSLLFELLV